MVDGPNFGQDMRSGGFSGDYRLYSGQQALANPGAMLAQLGLGPVAGFAGQAAMNAFMPGQEFVNRVGYNTNVQWAAAQHAAMGYQSMLNSQGNAFFSTAIARSMGIPERGILSQVGQMAASAFRIAGPQQISEVGAAALGSWAQTPGNSYRPSPAAVASATAGMSSYFGSQMRTGSEAVRFARRTAGLGMDDVAMNLATLRTMGLSGQATAAEARRMLHSVSQDFSPTEYFNTVFSGLEGEARSTAVEAARRNVESGMGIREAAATSLREAGLSNDRVSEALRGGRDRFSRAFELMDRYGREAISDLSGETMMQALRLDRSQVQEANRTVANLRDTNFMGTFAEFVDQVSSVFGQSQSLDPAFLRRLSQDLRVTAQETGKTVGELMNFMGVLRSIPGGANLSSDQLRGITQTSLMSTSETMMPGSLSQQQRTELAMGRAAAAARIQGSESALAARYIRMRGTDADRELLAAAQAQGPGAVDALLNSDRLSVSATIRRGIQQGTAEERRVLTSSLDEQRSRELSRLEEQRASASRALERARDSGDRQAISGAESALDAANQAIDDFYRAEAGAAQANRRMTIADKRRRGLNQTAMAGLDRLRASLGLGTEREAAAFLDAYRRSGSARAAAAVVGLDPEAVDMAAVGAQADLLMTYATDASGETNFGAYTTLQAQGLVEDRMTELRDRVSRRSARLAKQDSQYATLLQSAAEGGFGATDFLSMTLARVEQELGGRLGSSEVSEAFFGQFAKFALGTASMQNNAQMLADMGLGADATDAEIQAKIDELGAGTENRERVTALERFRRARAARKAALTELMGSDEARELGFTTEGGSDALATKMLESLIPQVTAMAEEMGKEAEASVPGSGGGSDGGLNLSGEVTVKPGPDGSFTIVFDGANAEENTPEPGDGN